MARKILPAPTRQPADLPHVIQDLDSVDEKALRTGEAIQDSRAVGIDLSAQQFQSLRLVSCLLEGLSFAESRIGLSRFRDVRLVKSDLSNSVLRGSELTRVEFIDCRLTGLKAIECRWRDVLLQNCDARYAQFTDGSILVSEFHSSQLQDADFRNVDLKDSLFVRSSLTRADLSGVRLHNVDLRGADISEVTLRAEDVKGAIVSPAQAMELSRLLGLIIR